MTARKADRAPQCLWQQPYPGGGLLACRKNEGHLGSHRPFQWARDHMGYSLRARWEPPPERTDHRVIYRAQNGRGASE